MDDDNDGLPDTVELGVLQASTERLNPDTDNDGTLDGADAFPLDPFESVDTDGDGIGNNADDDDDNDGLLDGSDNCPTVQNTAAFPDSEGWDPQQDDDSDNVGNACDLVIPPQFVPPASVGNPYNHALTVLRGTAPHTWTLTSGFLPADLTLSTGGVISGPTTAGGFTATFTVQVMDNTGDTATRVLKLKSKIPNCVNCHSASTRQRH
jgi:hypothetical protein